MRFRTRIFLGWVVLSLGLFGGAYLAVRHSVQQSFDRMASDTFTATSQGLRQIYLEQVQSMQQACQLVVNIPELRALIADQNHEMTAQNEARLRERLNHLSLVVEADFIGVLGERGLPIAQNSKSPWGSPESLRAYLATSPEAWSLVEETYLSGEEGQYGLWVFDGEIYRISAVPIALPSAGDWQPTPPDGALLMGERITNVLASELGASHGCEVTFLTGGRICASSLSPTQQADLMRSFDSSKRSLPDSLEMEEVPYRSTVQSLIDPCSEAAVGVVVIQQNRLHARQFLWEVGRDLLVTTIIGIVAAALASFVLSLAVTRPVHALLVGVEKLRKGDFNVSFHWPGRDELSQLGRAFNSMVESLRHWHVEQDRLLAEARKGAQREHLLREVAQQINRRLEVQSSVTMFLESVRDLFRDVQLSIYQFDVKATEFTPLDLAGCFRGGVLDTTEKAYEDQLLADFAVRNQLIDHKVVYLHEGTPAVVKEPFGPIAGATCLLPMQAEHRLLGVIVARRRQDVGFSEEERNFLAVLADHFAIALANAQVHEKLVKAYDKLRTNQRQIIETERMRALGQMASGIAHDFNNHLTGVLAFLELSLDREDIDEELRSWLEMSHESSMAASEVVQLLRSFYRRGDSDKFEAVDLNKLVSSTVALTRPRWFDMPREKGQVVRICEDLSEVGPALGNPAELRDALTNLIFNAVDAMPEGGEIIIRTQRYTDHVVLEVIDNGTGMSEAVRRSCLEPFYTTKGSHGTGLGLSMVHSIVERSRGSLEIESQLGQGTTVRVIFKAASVTSEEQPDQHVGEASVFRVLCVDDDERVLLAISEMLKQLGHEVTSCNSGAVAIERASTGEFDVVITDLGMPHVDGREVACRVKASAPNTLVLMLTGWADRLAVEGEMPAGVDAILAKPITKEVLQQALYPEAVATAVPAYSR